MDVTSPQQGCNPSISLSLSVELEGDKSRQMDRPRDRSWRAQHLQRTRQERMVTHRLAGGRKLEGCEIQARVRLVRTSQTRLKARSRAALYNRAKSIPGTAPLRPPLCVCVRIQPRLCREAPAVRAQRASPEAQTRGRCQIPGIFFQLRGAGGCHTGSACTCATPSHPAINSRPQHSDAVSLTAPFPSGVINQPPR